MGEREKLSKLDEQLELLRSPVDEHIRLSGRAARRILFDRLLADYRNSAGNLGQVTNPAVEVLASIAGNSNELVDFTVELEKFIREREEKLEAIQHIEAKGNINIVGPKTTQPEI